MTDTATLTALMMPGDDATLSVLVRYLRARPDWMDAAACRGSTATFFPELGQNAAEAKAVCHRCPVLLECMDYAMSDASLAGVWGRAIRSGAVPRPHRGGTSSKGA